MPPAVRWARVLVEANRPPDLRIAAPKHSADDLSPAGNAGPYPAGVSQATSWLRISSGFKGQNSRRKLWAATSGALFVANTADAQTASAKANDRGIALQKSAKFI